MSQLCLLPPPHIFSRFYLKSFNARPSQHVSPTIINCEDFKRLKISVFKLFHNSWWVLSTCETVSRGRLVSYYTKIITFKHLNNAVDNIIILRDKEITSRWRSSKLLSYFRFGADQFCILRRVVPIFLENVKTGHLCDEIIFRAGETNVP